MSDQERSEMNMGLATILASLNSISEDLKEMKAQIGDHAKLAQQFEVWKAETNLRLAQGVERMNELQRQVDGRIEKKVVLAYLMGAGAGGAGLAAGAIKLLGL